MQVSETKLKGVYLIEPDVFGDQRGWFMETYSKTKMAQYGLDTVFRQDNQSYSAQKGTLRGLHFQNNPKSQTKLVRCTRGAILDVAVDIREGSPQYCVWVAIELSAQNFRQLFIPKGFAHGFVTLTDDVEIVYKVDEDYTPTCDRGIRYDDPTLAVDWGAITPILSTKDAQLPYLKASDCNYIYS